MRPLVLICAVCLFAVFPVAALAVTQYVTDEFEITLRSGESTQHSIVRMLTSGTPLEILAPDPGNGYTHVRAPGGTEGYVLTRFLMPQAAARAQLEELRARLARASNDQGGLSRQLDELVQRNTEAEREIAELRSSRDTLSAELERIRAISADAIRIEERNRELNSAMSEQQARIAALSTENENLREATSRKWFLAGGGLVVFSMLFGIALTRVRWRRRSSWSDF